MKNNKRIYLDDERIPKGNDFTILRSYQDFLDWINENGMPSYISFDHDIASYDKNGEEKTGMDAAKFVVDYCLDNGIECPDFNVHSANPVGADNIQSLLDHLKRFQNNNPQ